MRINPGIGASRMIQIQIFQLSNKLVGALPSELYHCIIEDVFPQVRSSGQRKLAWRDRFRVTKDLKQYLLVLCSTIDFRHIRVRGGQLLSHVKSSRDDLKSFRWYRALRLALYGIIGQFTSSRSWPDLLIITSLEYGEYLT